MSIGVGVAAAKVGEAKGTARRLQSSGTASRGTRPRYVGGGHRRRRSDLGSASQIVRKEWRVFIGGRVYRSYQDRQISLVCGKYESKLLGSPTARSSLPKGGLKSFPF